MIERARERARREGVVELVDFRVGDAQKLPLADNSFDIVMGEFITGLLPDKQRALSEYVGRGRRDPSQVFALTNADFGATSE